MVMFCGPWLQDCRAVSNSHPINLNMTRKTWLIVTAVVALLCIAAGAWWASARSTGTNPAPAAPATSAASVDASSTGTPAPSAELLVRPHSPILGPVMAPVTIVEFFDPACEACRAFYPYVKEILARHPQDVRLVLRYVPLHGEASVQAIQILESARAQQRLEPVLEALLDSQDSWAAHHQPKPELAWDAAQQAGLDREKAQQLIAAGAPGRLMASDNADAKTLGISGTPSFFVNGQPLTTHHPDALYAMVQQALGQAPRR